MENAGLFIDLLHVKRDRSSQVGPETSTAMFPNEKCFTEVCRIEVDAINKNVWTKQVSING